MQDKHVTTHEFNDTKPGTMYHMQVVMNDDGTTQSAKLVETAVLMGWNRARRRAELRKHRELKVEKPT